MENQNMEWKEKWRDDYLHTICAFANAGGGTMEIGRDNNGAVVGVSDARKLLETLPNKFRNAMGIAADVDIMEKNSKHFYASLLNRTRILSAATVSIITAPAVQRKS